MASGFTVFTRFTAGGNLSRELDNIHRQFGQVGRMASGAKRMLMGIGTGAVVGGAAALAYGVNEVKNEFIDLDQAITNAASKWGPSFDRGSQGFNDLMEAAKGVGLTTEHQSAQAAEGLNFLAMAGFTAEESMALLPGVANLATSANLDFAQSTDIASDALGAFGMAYGTVEEKQNAFSTIMGQTAMTVNKANTDITQWFEAVKSGAPSFTTAGQSMASFNAAVALLANNGIKGEQAGTALRGMMANLSKTTGKQADTLRMLGVRVKDSGGNFRDFADILGDIEKATAKMGTAKRVGVLERLFGKQQMSQAAILLKEGADRFKDMRAEIEDSAGAEIELAGKMRKSIANSVKLVESALLGKGIDIIQRLFGGEDPAEALTNLATKIQEFDIGPLVEDIRSVIKIMKDSAYWVKENKDMLIALGEAFIMFKVGTFAADMANGIQAIAGIGRAASGAKQQVGGLNKALGSLGPLIAGLTAAYQALDFAAKGIQAHQEAALERKRGEASLQRKFSKADITGWSEKGLKEFLKQDEAVLEQMGSFGDEDERKAIQKRIANVRTELFRRRANQIHDERLQNEKDIESQPWLREAKGITESQIPQIEESVIRNEKMWNATQGQTVQQQQRNETIRKEETTRRYEVDWGTPPPGVTVKESPLSAGEM